MSQLHDAIRAHLLENIPVTGTQQEQEQDAQLFTIQKSGAVQGRTARIERKLAEDPSLHTFLKQSESFFQEPITITLRSPESRQRYRETLATLLSNISIVRSELQEGAEGAAFFQHVGSQCQEIELLLQTTSDPEQRAFLLVMRNILSYFSLDMRESLLSSQALIRQEFLSHNWKTVSAMLDSFHPRLDFYGERAVTNLFPKMFPVLNPTEKTSAAQILFPSVTKKIVESIQHKTLDSNAMSLEFLSDYLRALSTQPTLPPELRFLLMSTSNTLTEQFFAHLQSIELAYPPHSAIETYLRILQFIHVDQQLPLPPNLATVLQRCYQEKVTRYPNNEVARRLGTHLHDLARMLQIQGV